MPRRTWRLRALVAVTCLWQASPAEAQEPTLAQNPSVVQYPAVAQNPVGHQYAAVVQAQVGSRNESVYVPVGETGYVDLATGIYYEDRSVLPAGNLEEVVYDAGNAVVGYPVESLAVETLAVGSPVCSVCSGAYSPCSSCDGCYGGACQGFGCGGGLFGLRGNPCFRPRLTAHLGWVSLLRSDAEGQTLFTTIGGVPLFDAQDFDFDYESGVDTSFVYDRGGRWQIEGRMLWIEETDSTGMYFNGPLGGALATTPPTFYTGAANALVTYRSELQSMEANLRGYLDGPLRYTVGFRYLQYDESLNANLAAFPIGAVGALVDAGSENKLYGLQVGVASNALFCVPQTGFRIDGFAKTGVSDNSAKSRLSLQQPPGAFLGTAMDADQELAFISELGLYGSVSVTRNISIRAGFQLLWMEGLALAPEQIPVTGRLNAGGVTPTSIDLDGGVFYQGWNAGVTGHW